ncbi:MULTISPECIES: hypothetical protein [unclassified Marinovum]|uniref:hypothetical protein n=1 Tax=unclassified Marinovum TaxID=2647166 RepID=UPI0026E3B2E1|nr:MULTISPECIES: hypothetical protein [unclassified Marinovum]
MFSLVVPDPLLFQAFGAVGVGAFLAHFAFIRSTYAFRLTVKEQTRSFVSAAVLDGAGSNSLSAAEVRLQLQKETSELENVLKEEDRSVFFEVLFVFIATLQWGFGDRLVNRFATACGDWTC